MLAALLNHLWQSTVFGVVAWMFTLALKRNRAQTRYWVWFAASMKFLVPMAVLVAAGSLVSWRTAPALSMPIAMEQISQPFTAAEPVAIEAVRTTINLFPELLLLVWGCGFIVIVTRWGRRWTRMHADMHEARVIHLGLPVPVKSLAALREPGVFGILRPVLLLPEGITDRLTPAQLEAILAHEMCHVRRRDNLMTAMHMVVEAVFWFHPLVWWIGARLMEERERACDEEVLRSGNDSQTYAEGILKVCGFYLASPLECVAGVGRVSLNKRIEEIMTNRMMLKLSAGRKLLLAGAGMLTVAGPIAIGLTNAQQVGAQQPVATPRFEVASVKPDEPSDKPGEIRVAGGGRLDLGEVTVKMLVEQAYAISGYRIYGGPSWFDSARYSIVAKAADEAGNLTLDQMRPMLRTLLADRFHLTVHREEKDLPMFRLVVSKGGPKLRKSLVSGPPKSRMGMGRITDEKASLDTLASELGQQLGRFVSNQTGLKGDFDFHVEWTPDPGQNIGGDSDTPPPAGADGPSIFTALQEQLGLRLESGKGPVEVIVVDRVEKPDED